MYPLFPGTNEADQIQKIHNIMGTPDAELLDKFRAHAAHIDLNFTPKEGTGIAKLLPHASSDCIDLICKLLEYNPEQRITARQALRHNYFKELRAAEKKQRKAAESLAAAAMQVPASLPPPVQEQPSQQHMSSVQAGATNRRAPANFAPANSKFSTVKRSNAASSTTLPNVGAAAGGAAAHNAESLLPSVQGGGLLKASGNVQPSKNTSYYGASSKWHSQQEVRAQYFSNPKLLCDEPLTLLRSTTRATSLCPLMLLARMPATVCMAKKAAGTRMLPSPSFRSRTP
jgi:serine/threonine protein kinase